MDRITSYNVCYTKLLRGSAAGAMLVLRLRPDFLRPLILVLLVVAAGVVAFSYNFV